MKTTVTKKRNTIQIDKKKLRTFCEKARLKVFTCSVFDKVSVCTG
jgi:hypothetical protein